MARLLAVSDEVSESLWATGPGGRVDLLVSCGDLPADYLDRLQTALDVPLVYVPGNHDPDLRGYRRSRAGLVIRAGMPTRSPGPPGGVNADLKVIDAAGLRLAGFGGCPRYRPGPNQWTRWQERRRASFLLWRCWRRRPLDVLLTHAPPRGLGDGDDPAHRGFAELPRLVRRLRPRLLLHGHVHPYGATAADRSLGSTRIVNVVGHRVLDLPDGGEE